MSDVVSAQRQMSKLYVSPQFDSYSKVRIHVSDDVTYEYGNDVGRTLELDNPFGTQQMCQDILNRLRGYRYQPYDADGAIIDPAAEMGDALDSPLVYGGIYTRSKTFGRLMKADVTAPQSEEIDHEYAYDSPEHREFKRETADLRASLIVANDRITAEVARASAAEGNLSSQINQTAEYIQARVVANTGGNNASFGWELTANGFKLYSSNQEVLKCDSGGLTVTGNVASTSGTIGGFTISNSALFTNSMSYYGSGQGSGVHLSASGIQLGQNFKVDSAGNLYANNVNIQGSLNVGGNYITAYQLGSGAMSAYSNGGSWSNAYTSACTSGGYCYSASAGWNSIASKDSGSYSLRPYRVDVQYAVSGQRFQVNTNGGGFWSLESHDHNVYVVGGTVTIGSPRTGVSGSNSFNIADTATYKNGVSAAWNQGYSAGYSAGATTVDFTNSKVLSQSATYGIYARIRFTNGTNQIGWIPW